MPDMNASLERLSLVRKDLQDLLFEEMREPGPDPKAGYQPREARPGVVTKIARAVADVDDAMSSVREAHVHAKR